ncbi:unnamed protein product [Timema podura]|uniref:Uncharacterized protein n=1 Tax=Timema podura TaxID=61482 RepID=A0ABN7P2I4_TIMPD|nr:unnamed protein product [Timema podura]
MAFVMVKCCFDSEIPLPDFVESVIQKCTDPGCIAELRQPTVANVVVDVAQHFAPVTSGSWTTYFQSIHRKNTLNR